jgi:branched-chain amino acid transport system substrate-binding protein
MAALRAALVTSLTGPLARFGQTTATALGLWAEAAAELPRPWTAVTVELHDAHPNPAAAMRAALATSPHVLFGPYGSAASVAAVGATRRVVWNHGGATSKLAWPRFPHIVNVLSPASSYYSGILQLVREADPDVVALSILHASSGFPCDVAGGAAATAGQLGFRVSTVTFAPGRAEEASARLPDGEVLLVAGAFEEEVAAARLLLRRRWRVAAFIGAGVQDVLAPLDDEREGLVGPAQWMPTVTVEPDEGPDASWFMAEFRDVTGREPEYPAAQAFAAGVLCARCLRESLGVDDAEQFAAAKRLRCRTLYGDFSLDATSGLQVGHEMLTVQWQGGQRRVVWPPQYADTRLVYPRTT